MASESRAADPQLSTTTTISSSSSNGAAAPAGALRGRTHPPLLQLQLGGGAEEEEDDRAPATCTAYGPALSTSGGGSLPDGWLLLASCRRRSSAGGASELLRAQPQAPQASCSADGWSPGRRSGRQSSRPSMLRLDGGGSSSSTGAVPSSSQASSPRRRSSVKAASTSGAGGGGASARRWGVNSGSGSGSTAGGRPYGTSWFLPTHDWGLAARAAPGSTWSRESVHIERVEQQHQVARHLGLLEEDGDPSDAGLQAFSGAGIAVAALAAAAAAQPAQSPQQHASPHGRQPPDSTRTASPSASALASPAASCRCSSAGQAAGAGAAAVAAAASRPSSSSGGAPHELTPARPVRPTPAAVLLPPRSARGSLPSTPLAGAAARTPQQQSKLGPRGGSAEPPRSLRDLCLGRHGAAALQQDLEADQAALAAADQAYFQQLHVLATHQAQLQAQLRDTFVLKAYKEFLDGRGLRQPACLRRLPTPTELDLHAAERRRRAQALREQQAAERRRSLMALSGSGASGSGSGGAAVRKRATQEQPGDAQLSLQGVPAAAVVAAAGAAGTSYAAAIAAAASAGVSLPSNREVHASSTARARSKSTQRASRQHQQQQLCDGLTHRRDPEQLLQQLQQASLQEPNSLAPDECRLLAALLTGGRDAAAAAAVDADAGAAAMPASCRSPAASSACEPPASPGCSSSSDDDADNDGGIDWDAIDLAEPSAACAVKAPAGDASELQGEEEERATTSCHHPLDAQPQRAPTGGSATLRHLLLAPPVDTSLHYCLTSRRHGGSGTQRAAVSVRRAGCTACW